MNIRTWGLMIAALMGWPVIASAQYVYTYTGPDFDTFGPIGTAGNP
jgi:hypothetical protein